MREATFKIFVGTNGTGKTTTMKKYLVANERNLIIPSSRDDSAWKGFPELKHKVVPEEDPMRPGKQHFVVRIPELHSFTGTRVFHVDCDARLFEAICDVKQGYRNGGLFLDDFRQYIYSKGSIGAGPNSMFIGRRHKMVDIFMACHSPQDISADLIRFNPDLVVFYTTSPPNDTTLAKVPNGQAFMDAVARVNRTNLARDGGDRFYKELVPHE